MKNHRLYSTIPKEARPWGSKAHLEWRKKERIEGQMNAPIRREETVRRFI